MTTKKQALKIIDAANKYRAALNEGGIADIADSVSDVISMLRDDFNLTDEDENFNSSEDN